MEIEAASGGTSEIIEPTYHPLNIGYQAGKGISHAVVFQWHS